MISKYLIIVAIAFSSFALGFVVCLNYFSPNVVATENPPSPTLSSLELPECLLGRCPEYSSIEVDGIPETFESIVVIPTAMTKGAGKIWIIWKNKILFESPDLAQITIEENGAKNGFTLSYWKDWSNLNHPIVAKAEYLYQNGEFKFVGGEEPK